MKRVAEFGCIVLAAGNRAHPEDDGDGSISKNLADLKGKPVLRHVIDIAIAAGIRSRQITVVVKPELSDRASKFIVDERIATQPNATGSIDAVRCAYEQHKLPPTEHLLVLMADQPNLNPAKVNHFMDRHRRSGKLVTVSTFHGDRNHVWYRKCGIIHRDVNGRLEAIVRSQFPAQTKSQELHAGPWVFNRVWLELCMLGIPKQHEGEIHLYSAAQAAACVFGVGTFMIGTPQEVLGIDHFEALQHIRSKHR